MSNTRLVQENSAHQVVRAASCELPERRAYFSNENRDCYFQTIFDTGFTQEYCPAGWTLTSQTANIGCSFAKALPVCERTTFSKSQAECCLRNPGTDPNCPPNFCTDKQDTEKCFTAIKEYCLDTPGNLQRFPECQVWARNNNDRSDVVAAARKFCNGSGTRSPGYTTLFCKCLNVNEKLLCEDENCFAYKFPELRAQSDCIADQCRKAEPGVFVPNDKPCATVCSNILNVTGSTISSESGIKILQQCDFTKAQTEEVKRLANLNNKTDAEARAIFDRAGVAFDKRILDGTKPPTQPVVVPSEPNVSGGGATKPDVETDGTGINAKYGGVPLWGWLLIGFAILILIVAIAVGASRTAPQAQQYYNQYVSKRNPSNSFNNANPYGF